MVSCPLQYIPNTSTRSPTWAEPLTIGILWGSHHANIPCHYLRVQTLSPLRRMGDRAENAKLLIGSVFLVSSPPRVVSSEQKMALVFLSPGNVLGALVRNKAEDRS